MKISKYESIAGKRVLLNEGKNTLIISNGCTKDLYWYMDCPTNELDYDKEFSLSMDITKENIALYDAFNELYTDIERINMDGIYIPPFIKTDMDRIEYIEDRKERFRRYNASHYNELYDPEERKITWYSDEVNHEVANYVEIIRLNDLYRINFHTQLPKEGFEKDYGSSQYIPIKFSNDGSRYEPFNLAFKKMSNSIQEIDDVNDKGHQIHIEEYIFAKKKTLKPNTNK